MESTKLLRSISDPKDAGHHVRPISRPNSIATDITNRTAQRTPNRRNDAQSPSSCASMSSSTPSGEGSSSQSEYFSYEADDLGSLKTATKPARTFEEWKPTLGTNYEILQSLKVGEKFDEQVPVFEGFLSKKRRRRGTGFQKVCCWDYHRSRSTFHYSEIWSVGGELRYPQKISYWGGTVPDKCHVKVITFHWV